MLHWLPSHLLADSHADVQLAVVHREAGTGAGNKRCRAVLATEAKRWRIDPASPTRPIRRPVDVYLAVKADDAEGQLVVELG